MKFLSKSQSPKTIHMESQPSVSILLIKGIKWDFLIQCGNMNIAPRIASVLLSKADLSVHHLTKVSHPQNSTKTLCNRGFVQTQQKDYKTSLVL